MTSRSLEPEEVSQQITESVRQLLNAASVVYRLDEGSGDLVVLAVCGLTGPIARGVRIPRGMGAVGCAVRDRQRVVTGDLLGDARLAYPPDLRAAVAREEYRAVLALPLITGERIVGCLAICRPVGWTFDEEQVRLAELFAAQAALALDNARLHEETQGRLKDTEALLAVTQATGRTAEPTEALRRTTKLLVQALGADTGGLLYFDTVEGRVVPLAGYRVPKELLDLLSGPLPLSHPFFEMMRTLDHPLCASDSQPDPRLREDPWTRSFPHKSILLLPVEIKKEVRGVFTLAWIRDPHRFSIDELRLAEGVAQQAGLALENLELLEGLHRRQQRLEALLEATRQLSRIQSLETLLQQIAAACGQMLGASGVGFRLVEGDELVVAARWGDAKDLMPALRLKAGEGLVGRVVATGEPLIVRDLGNDPRVIASHREIIRQLGYHEWLGVPVRVGEQLLGVLSVYTRSQGGFSADDLATASAFAAQASTALENARLYQEVRHAYDQLSRTQEQLIQAQKMEAVGRLAGGVAHDFNNLLTIIMGRTALLRKQLDGVARLDRHAALIEKTAQRAATLTGQLLAFSRKQLLQPKVLDLNGLVGNIGTLLRRLIGEDIDFLTVLGPGLAPVKADPGQLEQVLMNLVVNARDAMPGGGRVTLETANVVLDPTYASRHADVQAGPYVLLAVSDTGVGMDPATKAHMFEPFFTTKAPGKGTGLGLATVYGIVKQSSGHIAVYSEPGQGTTFKIYLPAVDQPIDAQEDGTVSSPPKGSETLLVVEDEDELRDLLAEVLETSGYTVLQAQNCADAIKLCAEREGSIDLLLTDVVMPQMSGRELADRLQKACPTMKVLYMSGYTDGAIVHHGILAAGVSFLQKPFTPVTVGQKVREVLDRNEHAAGVLSAS
jgi:signal transduction histidine kinase/ActR/RegA family two-component response regulator